MKKIVLLILSLNLFANDLVDIYLKDGIFAVQEKIESSLMSRNFWKLELDNKDLNYGYYSDDMKIIVVDKTAQRIFAYDLIKHKLNLNFEHKVITGLMGDKKVEGDLKTPVGVYDVLKKITPPEYYGPYAYVLSYPNLYDKVQKKTGSGIWIHGFPIEGDVRYDVYKTRGCVVMTNDILLDFENIIKDNKAVVLINENGVLSTNKDELALILSNLFEWKNAWTNNDINTYLSFYSEEFLRNDGLKFNIFKEQKKAVFKRMQKKSISFFDIRIVPYPNTQNKNMFVVSFMEDYKTATYKFKGEKVLYLEIKDDKISILMEK